MPDVLINVSSNACNHSWKLGSPLRGSQGLLLLADCASRRMLASI